MKVVGDSWGRGKFYYEGMGNGIFLKGNGVY